MQTYQTLRPESCDALPPTSRATVSRTETSQKRDTTLSIRKIICHSFTTIAKRCCHRRVNSAVWRGLFKMTLGQPGRSCESGADFG